jgi:peptidyl-prolyl cis-trans isomerase C
MIECRMVIMKYVAWIFIVAALAAIQICPGPSAAETGGEVLATVGNYKITRTMLDHIISTIPEENRVPFLTPDGRKKILDEVVSFVLFAQAARAKGIDSEPAIKTRLDYAQTEYLAREFFRRLLAKEDPVSEEDLKNYYKEHRDEFKPPEEIKARHILVRTESEAKKILDKLEGGEDFAKTAKKYSIDPAAAKGGRFEMQDGSIWLPRGTFEKSFEHALFKIPAGETGGPVKSQFGWHILKVEDRRQPETPAFVQVRSLIRNRLEDQKNNKLRDRISEELKKTIPVEIK